MLDLRHLRSLLAIADTGKLARAAERVHLTQSALSHQIKALESHYGCVLFERRPSGLRFTEAGERLLHLAHEVLAAVDTAERDLAGLRGEGGGVLRIVLECHTCFDWLMPVLDRFRQRWSAVEVDLVAGFHSDPFALIEDGRAELVIGAAGRARGLHAFPLFRFEIMAVLPLEHRLRSRRSLQPEDFAGETLITYPVPETRIDLIREVLNPAGVHLQRRTAELTVAILQLVASRRGIAALPSWGLRNYVDNDYVIARRIGGKGLWSDLYATVAQPMAERAWVRDFVEIARSECCRSLHGVAPLNQ